MIVILLLQFHRSLFKHLTVKVVTHKKVFFRKSLSKVTFKRNLARVSWELSQFVFFSKETFTIRTCSVLASFFCKLLSKATFSKENFLVCHYLYRTYQWLFGVAISSRGTDTEMPYSRCARYRQSDTRLIALFPGQRSYKAMFVSCDSIRLHWLYWKCY